MKYIEIEDRKTGGVIEMAKVEIRAESCKSCLYCIKFCHKNVLEVGEQVNNKGYQYVTVIRASECVGCLSCAVICPEAAIEIYE